MAELVLTRVAFCPKCKAEDRPSGKDWLLLYGGKRKSYFYKQVEYHTRSREKGFTPHIFQNMGFIKSDSAIMEVHYFCGVIGCDVLLRGENEDGSVNWGIKKPIITYMTYEEWEALRDFTDTGYEV